MRRFGVAKRLSTLYITVCGTLKCYRRFCEGFITDDLIENQETRRLASIRRIGEIRPIEGADAIECVMTENLNK